MHELIVSVSGLRGVVGESLTPDVALRFAAAYAGSLPPGPIVVSRDGRATGAMISSAVQAGVLATGHEVIDVDVVPTPTTGVLVRELGAAGGIQVTASHNPPEYNGLKLFSAEGRVIPAKPGEQQLARYRAGEIAWTTHERVGSRSVMADPLAHHLRLLLDRVDVDQLRARKMKVLVDANHGSGGQLARKLLSELGCDVTILGETPDGQFEHPPEPTAANLKDVGAKVREAGCDIGLCVDPDADRLAIIDESGRYIGEEYTLALCLDHVLRKKVGPVVTNCATSRMSQDIAARYGASFFRSAVGEANVVDEMKARGAIFGGEGNGGPIDPGIGFVRDSFVGMALVLESMTMQKKRISELVAALPRYEIYKDKVTLAPEKIAEVLAALPQSFPDAKASRLDGVRLDWEDRWIIVRASNTEPIVRLIAEAPTLEEAQELCRLAAIGMNK